ncbi:hypothetical protein [Pseudonocardia sp. 73-21]|uniref:hypothetical protein n=1 Tax=Pseudonocardia sp. 73-21 TaxID=1895809 RepID=UPI0026388BE9|nr:hypothetical protein [Pseudonocardia sp. 73-21]
MSGKPGKRALSTLDADGDLHDIDIDPGRVSRPWTRARAGELFEVDWQARQCALELPIVRLDGVYAGAKDRCALTRAVATSVEAGTIRVISLEAWLLRDTLGVGLRGGLRAPGVR